MSYRKYEIFKGKIINTHGRVINIRINPLEFTLKFYYLRDFFK